MKLKQVALVAHDLVNVRAQLFQLLGLETDFADPGVAEFGLVNSVMVIGDTFLEIVSPSQPGTTAGRLLERRGGDGGYMVISLVDDIAVTSERINDLGLRKVWEIDRPEVSAFHVHPRDIGAAIVSFDEMRPETEWLWAGPDWRDRAARHVSRISAVEVQSEDPETLAGKWARAFDRKAELNGDQLVMRLDEGEVRFLQAADGRGEGVCGVEFETSDVAAVREAAEQMGLEWYSDQVIVCGTRLRFGQSV